MFYVKKVHEKFKARKHVKFPNEPFGIHFNEYTRWNKRYGSNFRSDNFIRKNVRCFLINSLAKYKLSFFILPQLFFLIKSVRKMHLRRTYVCTRRQDAWHKIFGKVYDYRRPWFQIQSSEPNDIIFSDNTMPFAMSNSSSTQKQIQIGHSLYTNLYLDFYILKCTLEFNPHFTSQSYLGTIQIQDSMKIFKLETFFFFRQIFGHTT